MNILASDSGSDLEQAALLVGHRQQSWAGSSHRIGLFTGLAVAVICAVSLAASPSHVANQQSIALPKLGKLSGLVQAFSVQRSGRALTGHDVDALYSHLAGGGHPKARALLDRFSATHDSVEDEQGMEDVGLSQPCVDGIQDKLRDTFQSFAGLLVDAFFECILGADEECGAADKMDSFIDDMTAKCQIDGDFCNLTAIGFEVGKRVEESQAVCVPVACHQEAKQAMDYFKEQLGEQIEEAEAQADAQTKEQSKLQNSVDDCDNCTITIACGKAHGAGEPVGAAATHAELADAVHPHGTHAGLADAVHLQAFRQA